VHLLSQVGVHADLFLFAHTGYAKTGPKSDGRRKSSGQVMVARDDLANGPNRDAIPR